MWYNECKMRMKLLTFLAVLSAVPAIAAPTRDMDRRANRPAEKRDLYLGVAGAANFASWKNEYINDNGPVGSDKYSFEPVYGFSFSLGSRMSDNFRMDIQSGIFGEFTDSGEGFRFDLTAPYFMINSIYNTRQREWGGFYIGIGAGAALPRAEMTSNVYLIRGKSSKTKISLIGALQFGYEKYLTRSLVLTTGYKLSAWDGPQHSVEFCTDSCVKETFDVGVVVNNSLEAGLRFMF